MGGSQGEWMPFRPGSEACGSVFCRQWPENIVPDGELVGAKFGRLPEKSLSLPIRGEVLEWLKRRAWKARIRLKRIRGSNPLLSANDRGGRLGCKRYSFATFLLFGGNEFIRNVSGSSVVRTADGRVLAGICGSSVGRGKAGRNSIFVLSVGSWEKLLSGVSKSTTR